jgi:ferredoxin
VSNPSRIKQVSNKAPFIQIALAKMKCILREKHGACTRACLLSASALADFLMRDFNRAFFQNQPLEMSYRHPHQPLENLIFLARLDDLRHSSSVRSHSPSSARP